MKVRAVANGNIIDLPEGHGLITAGIYVPVDDEETPPEKAKTVPAPAAPATSTTSTKVDPLTTKDVRPPVKKKGA